MGIESTQTVKRSDAEKMLAYKGVITYKYESLDRLADLLYENRETIFENYCVVEDYIKGDEWATFKEWW